MSARNEETAMNGVLFTVAIGLILGNLEIKRRTAPIGICPTPNGSDSGVARRKARARRYLSHRED